MSLRKPSPSLSPKTVTVPVPQPASSVRKSGPRSSSKDGRLGGVVTSLPGGISSVVKSKERQKPEAKPTSFATKESSRQVEPAHEEQLRQDFAVLRRAAAELAQRKREAQTAALHDLAHVGEKSSFEVVSRSLEDPSAAVRQAAVRALYQINPEVAASFFNSALREGSAERRRVIGAALAGSDLATEAIYNLNSEDSRTTYRAFSLLFLLAKAGEAQPLMRVIEHHPNVTLRLAMIALLASSGETAVLPGFHQLVTQQSLPNEVRAAVMAAVDEIISRNRDDLGRPSTIL